MPSLFTSTGAAFRSIQEKWVAFRFFDQLAGSVSYLRQPHGAAAKYRGQILAGLAAKFWRMQPIVIRQSCRRSFDGRGEEFRLDFVSN